MVRRIGFDFDSPWVLALVDRPGMPLMSGQWEESWLPLAGPSAVVLTRAVLRAAWRGEKTVDGEALAARIGLGSHLSRNSALTRSFNRAIRFGLLVCVSDNGWRVMEVSACSPLPEVSDDSDS